MKDGFLVPPIALSVPLKFQREGIKYDDLSEEDKDQWDALEWDDTGNVPGNVDAFRSVGARKSSPREGTLEAARLFESPFTDLAPQGPQGLFPSKDLSVLLDALTKVRASATAA